MPAAAVLLDGAAALWARLHVGRFGQRVGQLVSVALRHGHGEVAHESQEGTALTLKERDKIMQCSVPNNGPFHFTYAGQVVPDEGLPVLPVQLVPGGGAGGVHLAQLVDGVLLPQAGEHLVNNVVHGEPEFLVALLQPDERVEEGPAPLVDARPCAERRNQTAVFRVPGAGRSCLVEAVVVGAVVGLFALGAEGLVARGAVGDGCALPVRDHHIPRIQTRSQYTKAYLSLQEVNVFKLCLDIA